MCARDEYQCFNCFQVNFYKFNKVENGLFSLSGGEFVYISSSSVIYIREITKSQCFSDVLRDGWLHKAFPEAKCPCFKSRDVWLSFQSHVLCG